MSDTGIKLPLAASAHLRLGNFFIDGLPVPIVSQTEYSADCPRVEYASAGASPDSTWVDGSAPYRGLLATTAVGRGEMQANQLAALLAAHMASHTALTFGGVVVGEIAGPARIAGPLWEGDELRIPITIPLTGY